MARPRPGGGGRMMQSSSHRNSPHQSEDESYNNTGRKRGRGGNGQSNTRSNNKNESRGQLSEDEKSKREARASRFESENQAPAQGFGKTLKTIAGQNQNPFAGSVNIPGNAMKSPFNTTAPTSTAARTKSPRLNPFAAPLPQTAPSFANKPQPPVPAERHQKSLGASPMERMKYIRAQREIERKDAMARGLIADPDRPRQLKDAVTPKGTCQDMCPEFERLTRIAGNDVQVPEFTLDTVNSARKDRVADETRMVKRYRRPAAGNEEALPSELRPPPVLKRTIDYLLDRLVNEGQPLSYYHLFLWDRTRAIRTDFTIQQPSTTEDLRITIECFERIVRFHVLALHELGCLEPKPYVNYDWMHDWEQVDKTFLSLMKYYQQARNKWRSPSEPELWSYWIIFHIKAQFTNVPDTIQRLPEDIRMDSRVQTALELYSLAQDNHSPQGPVLYDNQYDNRQLSAPKQNWVRFFKVVGSPQTPFLLACCAEIFFTYVRKTALETMLRSYRRQNLDWTVDDATDSLGFDDREELLAFIDNYGLSTSTRPADSKQVVDFNVLGKQRDLPTPKDSKTQTYSKRYVEIKRAGRNYSAIFDALSVKAATAAGLLDEDWVEPVVRRPEEVTEKGLFVTGISDDEDEGMVANAKSKLNPGAASFNPNGTNPFISFGTPSNPQFNFGSNAFGTNTDTKRNFKSPFAKEDDEDTPTQNTGPPSSFAKDAAPSSSSVPSFAFGKSPTTNTQQAESKQSIFNFSALSKPATLTEQPSFNFDFPAASTGPINPFKQSTPAAPFQFTATKPTEGAEKPSAPSTPFQFIAGQQGDKPSASPAPFQFTAAKPTEEINKPAAPSLVSFNFTAPIAPTSASEQGTGLVGTSNTPTQPAATNPFGFLIKPVASQVTPAQLPLAYATLGGQQPALAQPATGTAKATAPAPISAVTATSTTSANPLAIFSQQSAAPAEITPTEPSKVGLSSVLAQTEVGPATQQTGLFAAPQAAQPSGEEDGLIAQDRAILASKMIPPSSATDSLSPRAQRQEDMAGYIPRQYLVRPSGPLAYVALNMARDIVKQELRELKRIREEETIAHFRHVHLGRRYFRRWYNLVQEKKRRRKRKNFKEKVREANRKRKAAAAQQELETFRGALETAAKQRAQEPPVSFKPHQPTVETFASSNTALVPHSMSLPGAMGPPAVPAEHRNNKDRSVRRHKRVKSEASATGTIADALKVSGYGDDDLDPFLKLIRGPLPPHGKISTMKSDYFRRKAAGLHKTASLLDDKRKHLGSSLGSSSVNAVDSRRSSFSSSFGAAAPFAVADGLKRKRGNEATTPTMAKRLHMSSSPFGGASSVQSSTSGIVEMGAERDNDLVATASKLRITLTESQSFLNSANRSLDTESNAASAAGALPKPTLKKLPRFYSRQSRFIPRPMYGQHSPRSASELRQEQEEEKAQHLAAAAARVLAPPPPLFSSSPPAPPQQQPLNNFFSSNAGGTGATADDAIELDSD